MGSSASLVRETGRREEGGLLDRSGRLSTHPEPGLPPRPTVNAGAATSGQLQGLRLPDSLRPSCEGGAVGSGSRPGGPPWRIPGSEDMDASQGDLKTALQHLDTDWRSGWRGSDPSPPMGGRDRPSRMWHWSLLALGEVVSKPSRTSFRPAGVNSPSLQDRPIVCPSGPTGEVVQQALTNPSWTTHNSIWAPPKEKNGTAATSRSAVLRKAASASATAAPASLSSTQSLVFEPHFHDAAMIAAGLRVLTHGRRDLLKRLARRVRLCGAENRAARVCAWSFAGSCEDVGPNGESE